MHLSPPFITMSGWRDGKELLRLTKLRCNFFFANATFEIAGLAGEPVTDHLKTWINYRQ